MNPDGVPASWVSSRPSRPEAVARRHPHHEGVKGLLARRRPEEEIRAIRAPREAWSRKVGRRGYGRVRDGVLVEVVWTAVN